MGSQLKLAGTVVARTGEAETATALCALFAAFPETVVTDTRG
jgi:hypothetical protein